MSDSNKLMKIIEEHSQPDSLIYEIMSNAFSKKVAATDIICRFKWDIVNRWWNLQIDYNGEPLVSLEDEKQFFSIGSSVSTGHRTTSEGHNGFGWKSILLSEFVEIINILPNEAKKFTLDKCNQRRDNHCLVSDIDDMIRVEHLLVPCRKPDDFPFERGMRFYAQGYFSYRTQEINTLLNTTGGLQKLFANISSRLLTEPRAMRKIVLYIQSATTNSERKIEIINQQIPIYEIEIEVPRSGGGTSDFEVLVYNQQQLEHGFNYPLLVACRNSPQFIENKITFHSKDLRLLLGKYLVILNCRSKEPHLRIDGLFNEARTALSPAKSLEWSSILSKIEDDLLKGGWCQEEIQKLQTERGQEQSQHKSAINTNEQQQNMSRFNDESKMDSTLLRFNLCYIPPSKREEVGDERNIQSIYCALISQRLLPEEYFPYRCLVLRTNTRGIDFTCRVWDTPNISNRPPNVVFYEVEDNLSDFRDHSTEDVQGILCDVKNTNKLLKTTNGVFPIEQDLEHSYIYYVVTPSRKVPIFVLSEYLDSQEFQEIVKKKQKM